MLDPTEHPYVQPHQPTKSAKTFLPVRATIQITKPTIVIGKHTYEDTNPPFEEHGNYFRIIHLGSYAFPYLILQFDYD